MRFNRKNAQEFGIFRVITFVSTRDKSTMYVGNIQFRNEEHRTIVYYTKCTSVVNVEQNMVWDSVNAARKWSEAEVRDKKRKFSCE